MWSLSLGIGTQILNSHRVGAQEFDQVDRQVKLSSVQGIAGCLMILSPLYLFSDFFISLFSQTPEVVEIVKPLLIISFFRETGRSVNIIVGFTLRGVGDAAFPTIMSFFVMFVVLLPLCWLLGLYWSIGLFGIRIAMSIDEWIRVAINYGRWTSSKWKEKGVLAQSKL